MKRMLACSILFFVAATPIFADEAIVDGVMWGYSLNEGSVTIERRYDSAGLAIPYQGDLVVPSRINGCPVTTIAAYAFRDSPELKSVELPNSIVEIKHSESDYAHAIYGAFWNCSKLERVTLPKGLKNIEPGTFSGCSSLNQIILPFGLETIGEEAFCDCSSLLEIDVPTSVVSIGEDAFEGCSSANKIILNEGLLEIGGGAFQGCKSVKTLTIPSTVTNVGAFAFAECPKAEETVVPSCALPLEDAFRDTCVVLRKVVICDGVTAIPSRAFKGCTNVDSIGIPASVVSIGYDSFSSTAWWVNQPDGLVIQDGCCIGIKGVCPSNVEIPFGVRLIAGGAFEQCDTLVGVSIPDGVVTIGSSAFAYCGNLTTVDIPQSVVRIGYDAFWHCSKLYSVVLPAGLTEIEEAVFDGCCELALVEIPEGVKKIGRSAFAECANMESVTLPQSVAEIGDFAFSGCSKIKEVQLLDGVTWIGDMVFCACKKLERVTIGKNLQGLGHNVFFQSGLKELVFNGQVFEPEYDVLEFVKPVVYVLPNHGWGKYVSVGYWQGTKIQYNPMTETLYVRVPDSISGGEDIYIEKSWGYEYPLFQRQHGDDPATAYIQTSGKFDSKGSPMYVWQDYVAGTDPTDVNSVFKAKITMVDGKPKVEWEPNLNENGVVREYKVFGKENLTDAEWQSPISDQCKFFKVEVSMPK